MDTPHVEWSCQSGWSELGAVIVFSGVGSLVVPRLPLQGGARPSESPSQGWSWEGH